MTNYSNLDGEQKLDAINQMSAFFNQNSDELCNEIEQGLNPDEYFFFEVQENNITITRK